MGQYDNQPQDHLIHRFNDLGLPNPFSCHELKKWTKDHTKLEQLTLSLENTKQNDPRCYFATHANFLTFLYIKGNKLAKADNENKWVLKHEPQNILALMNDFHIRLNRKRYSCREPLTKLEEMCVGAKLEQMDVNDKPGTNGILLRAKHELAFCISCIGTSCLNLAIKLYEHVVDNLLAGVCADAIKCDFACHDIVECPHRSNKCEVQLCDGFCCQPGKTCEITHCKKFIFMVYSLAQLYNKVLNKSNMHGPDSPIAPKHFDPKLYFAKITKLLAFVIRSREHTLQGRAYVDLGDALKKCELYTRHGAQDLQLPSDLHVDSSDACFETAFKLTPGDSYVCERYGRHLRQHASNYNDFDRAINMLLKAVDINKSNHVALHHLGLAHRSLWIFVHELPERKLYCKKPPVLRMGKRGKGKNKSKPGCERSKSDSACSYSTDRASEDDAAISGQKFQRSISDTIMPSFFCGVADLPRHGREPDYFDKLRTSNPTLKEFRRDDGRNQYIYKALEYIEMASNLQNNICCRYLVDMARIHLSLGRTDDAEDLFEKASRCYCNSNSKTYLYEQWGLFRFSQIQTQTYELEDVKCHLRQALKCAVVAKQRSRMAFYKLRDILREQLDDNPDDMCVRQEHAFIYKCIEQYREAAQTLESVPALMHKSQNEVESAARLDPQIEPLLLELIQLFQTQGHTVPASKYLRIFLSTTQKQYSIEAFPHLDVRQFIDIALYEPIDVELVQAVYRWFVPFCSLARTCLQCSKQPCKFDEIDILIYATDIYDVELVDKVDCLLKTYCGLETFLATLGGNDDMHKFQTTKLDCFDTIEKHMCKVRGVLWFTHDGYDDPELRQGVSYSLKHLANRDNGVCRVDSSSNEDDQPSHAMLQKFNPIRVNSNTMSDNELTRTILEHMCQKYPQTM